MLKLGIIGLGSIGTRHAKNLTDLGHVVYFYDPNISNLSYSRYYDLNTMCRDVDAVLVCSPTNYHLYHTMIAQDAKKKVFIEKPMVEYHWQAGDIRLGQVMVGNNLRYHQLVRRAKELMPIIGKPKWSNFTVAQKNTKYTDPVILNWGAHEVDLATFLIGKGRGVCGCDVVNVASMMIEHSGGCQTSIHMDYFSIPPIRDSIIVGDKGWLTLDLENGVLEVHQRNIEEVKMTVGRGQEDFDVSYVDEMKAFTFWVETCVFPEFAATGFEATEVMKIIGDCRDAP